MYYLNEINKFNIVFGFENDDFIQDWDIENASSNRLIEFINYYKENNLNNDEKMTLMALVLASFDEYLNENKMESEKLWENILILIKEDRFLFEGLLYSWSMLKYFQNMYEVTGSYNNIKYDENQNFKLTNIIRRSFYNL